MIATEPLKPLYMFGNVKNDSQRIRFDRSVYEPIIRDGDFAKARHRRTGKYYAIVTANDQWYIGIEVLP